MINSYKDLLVWQKLMNFVMLAPLIYKLTNDRYLLTTNERSEVT